MKTVAFTVVVLLVNLGGLAYEYSGWRLVAVLMAASAVLLAFRQIDWVKEVSGHGDREDHQDALGD